MHLPNCFAREHGEDGASLLQDGPRNQTNVFGKPKNHPFKSGILLKPWKKTEDKTWWCPTSSLSHCRDIKGDSTNNTWHVNGIKRASRLTSGIHPKIRLHTSNQQLCPGKDKKPFKDRYICPGLLPPDSQRPMRDYSALAMTGIGGIDVGSDPARYRVGFSKLHQWTPEIPFSPNIVRWKFLHTKTSTHRGLSSHVAWLWRVNKINFTALAPWAEHSDILQLTIHPVYPSDNPILPAFWCFKPSSATPYHISWLMLVISCSDYIPVLYHHSIRIYSGTF